MVYNAAIELHGNIVMKKFSFEMETSWISIINQQFEAFKLLTIAQLKRLIESN